MFILYSFLFTVGFLLLTPLFLLKREKYAAGFWQRFGYLPAFESGGKPVIWLHCVSVGETNAARPLVEELAKNYSEYLLVVSTTTKTGQNLARELFKDKAALVFYFPFDWRFTVKRALKIIKPNIVLIMETEIWFNFIREAGRSGAHIFLINGRLSERSLNRYLRIKKTFRRVFHYIDLAMMQGYNDAERLMQLGVRANKIKITGNLKFDQKSAEGDHHLTAFFQERFGISDKTPLIVAASTHAPEEKWILEAFKAVYKSSGENLPRLLIAPRHPERFAEVAEMIDKTGFKWVRRNTALSFDDEMADVILLDTIGELRAVYPLAKIVFVGGSLIPHGGQSVLEPAIERKAIVTGAFTMNFAEIVKKFVENDALIQLPELRDAEIPEMLAEVFLELLNNKDKREKIAENAFATIGENRGACERTIKLLKPSLLVQGNMLRAVSKKTEFMKTKHAV
jgi:3-deoxy-D-manno-octulosonic-acid transferase